MWWSKKGRKAAKVAAETLEERQVLLEAEFRSLKTEWIDIYDKLYRLAGRIDAGKRWPSEKAPSPATTAPAIVPENGSEAQIAAPLEATEQPTARMSRSELLQSLTR